MSLKNLLPPGTYDEIVAQAHDSGGEVDAVQVRCPQCGRSIVYDRNSPFRPFCSRKCKLLDLGAWASEERTIRGEKITEDEDAEWAGRQNLSVRNVDDN